MSFCSRDFTFKKYKQLIETIKNSGYKTYTFKDYIKESKKRDLADTYIVIMRHDIDNKVDHPIALEMAKYEQSIGMPSTYYFRTIPDAFNKDLIAKISGMGHEIGYHYEVLNETQGDFSKAVELFKYNLEKMREICPIETICQHGGSLGDLTASTFKGFLKTGIYLLLKKKKIKSFESKKIWEKYSFEDFGILGETYLSLNFDKTIYFSDTGVSWDAFKKRVLDTIDTDYYSSQGRLIRTTNDLIELISSKKIYHINILTHPANWIDPLIPWIKWRILQVLRDFGKRKLLKNKK